MFKTIPWVRIYIIVSFAVRCFMEMWLIYRKKGTQSNEWNEALLKQGQKFNKIAIYLEGLMVKVGQFLSTRVDVLPVVFTQQLLGLVDRVPPMDWKQAHQVLEKSWGKDYPERISVVKMPKASASIAVVYEGYFVGTEQKLAIKIQRPTIQRMIRADLRAIRIVLWLGKTLTSWGKWVDTQSIYREIEDTILRELDFRLEPQHANQFTSLTKLFQVIVPKYYEEYTTSQVLVMNWIESVPITNRAYLEHHGLSATEVTFRLVSAFLWQLTQGGCFHADPHPGNVHIQQDGTIVLFDFGMIGILKTQNREALVKLIRTAILRDYVKMTDALEELGFLRKPAFRKQVEQSLSLFMDIMTSTASDQWDENQVLGILKEMRRYVNEQPLQLPAEFAFFGRAIGILIGVVQEINPQIDYFALGRRLLPQLGLSDSDSRSQEYSLFSGVWQEIGKQALEMVKTIVKTPYQIRDTLHAVTQYVVNQQTNEQSQYITRFYMKKRQSYFWLTMLFTGISGLIFVTNTSISTVISKDLSVFIFAIIASLMFLQMWRWDRKWYHWIMSQK
jgi:predicted unusual protein kinase regulating ubiquinone biosynthesis (AarF/ABC1/UbiB family)